MKLINTSVIYDDGSKTEQYTDTGNIETAKYKAVPYDYDYLLKGYCKKYFLLYERCSSGLFGNYVKGVRVKFNSLKDCINFLNNLNTKELSQ